MKALGLVVSDKKIFENCILKTYLLTPWPTYVTNWSGLNNFDRGPPRDHSCEVWSKSNKRFQRRCCLKKLLMHGRTQGRTTDAGHWRITKVHLSTSCSGELKRDGVYLRSTDFLTSNLSQHNIQTCTRKRCLPQSMAGLVVVSSTGRGWNLLMELPSLADASSLTSDLVPGRRKWWVLLRYM